MNNSHTPNEFAVHLNNLAATVYHDNPDAARTAKRAAMIIEQCMKDMAILFKVFKEANVFIKHFYFDNDLPSEIADWDLVQTGPWTHGKQAEDALKNLAVEVFMTCSELRRREERINKPIN